MKINEVRHLLTYSCNLRCKHCYLSAGEELKDKKEFTQEQLDKFYGFFKPKVVSATGGEPLMRKDFVFKLARSTNQYSGALEIVTNGFFLTPEVISELQNINQRTFYQISLDGPEQFHNQLRGSPHAYEKAMHAIDIASASGAKTKVRLTVTEDNYPLIPEVIKSLDAYQRSNIQLVMRPVVPRGRAGENKLSANIPFSDLDNFAKLAKIISVSTTDNEGKCGCGVDTLAINPRGDIYPCTYFVHNSKYKMGDIEHPEKLAEHDEFKNYRGTCYARHIQSLSL